jgi:hypothetical protein
METRQTKGSAGEERVARAIANLGYKVIHVGGAVRYALDGLKFFCADLLPYGNQNTFWVQVKHKEPRIYFPDTGLELWRYKALIKHQSESGRPVLLLFTDDSTANSVLGVGEDKIYGEWLDKLSECVSTYGSTWNKADKCEMIYFLLSKLKHYKMLLNSV